MKMISAVFLLLAMQAFGAEWPADSAGVVSKEVCDKTYAYPVWITRPYSSVSAETFSFFATITKPFDPHLGSVLYVAGGPGEVLGKAAMESLSKAWPDANLVFYHLRGTGCSAFPLSDQYDQFMNSSLAVADLEVLREHLGISRWAAVMGTSYGGVMAPLYANHYPGRLDRLILISQSKVDNHSESSMRILDLLNYLRSRHGNIFSRLNISELNTNLLFSRIEIFLKNLDRSNVEDAWKMEESKLRQELNRYLVKDKAIPQDVATKLISGILPGQARVAFFSLSKLFYTGALPMSDWPIAGLARAFGFYTPNEEWNKKLDDYLALTMNYTRPVGSLDEIIGTSGFGSQRALKEFRTADNASLKSSDLCNPVPTLVIHGRFDFQTPYSNVEEYLNLPNCPNHPIITAIHRESGHFIPDQESPDSCLEKMFHQFIQNGQIAQCAPGSFDVDFNF